MSSSSRGDAAGQESWNPRGGGSALPPRACCADEETEAQRPLSFVCYCSSLFIFRLICLFLKNMIKIGQYREVLGMKFELSLFILIWEMVIYFPI